MSRLQLALNVSDIDQAVDFYSKVFATGPHKRRAGYANFEIAEPPLKLVLFESPDHGGSLNHLGVEVETADEVGAAIDRLGEAGILGDIEVGEVCCHARQDKINFADPDGGRWEVYTVTDDDPDGLGLEAPEAGEQACSPTGCCA